MDSRMLLRFVMVLLVVFGVCAGTEGPTTVDVESDAQPEVEPVPFHAALTGYTYWMQRVSRIFQRQPVETMNMDAIEEEGEEVHNLLINAIMREEQELNMTINREKLSQSVLKTLEKDMKVDTVTVMGLVLAQSPIASQGARMTVSVGLFTKMTEKMQKLHQDFKHDSKYLKRVFKIMSASEIALDTMISSFKFVEKLELGELSHHRSKRQICSGPPVMSGPSRPLGGGFSTNGNTLVFQNGGTTVTATPHFNILPKPEITGGNVGLEHRFQNFPGTLQGHVTVDGSGRVQNAGINLKIDL